MKKDAVPMTKAGLEKLNDELIELETVKREKAKVRIKKARSFCDFREDFEYESALKDLAAIEDRIATLQYMIQQAEVIGKTKGQFVEFGSTATLKELPDGELETYTIVGVEEADPFEGKISYISPLAKSLLGTKTGDIIDVDTPGGRRKVEIVEVE